LSQQEIVASEHRIDKGTLRIERTLRSFLQLCYGPNLSTEDLYVMLGYNASVPPHVRQALFSRSFDNDDLLPKIRKPVLITHAAADGIVRPSVVDQARKSVAHAEIHMISTPVHACFWSDAAEFNLRLQAFAEKCRATAGLGMREKHDSGDIDVGASGIMTARTSR
jgi:pimeloyl-ACP methyl ester carboxylesterase